MSVAEVEPAEQVTAREHRKLRVLLAPSAYYPHVGGIEELTRQLARALLADGHAVAVLTNRWPAGTSCSEILDGIEVTRLRFALPAKHPARAAKFLASALMTALQLRRHLRRWRPDIVHVIGAGPQAAYLVGLRRLLHAALVFTAQGELRFDAHDVFARSQTLRAGLRGLLRSADAVTACSAFVLHELEEWSEIHVPVSVIPNGVDPDEFSESAEEGVPGSYVLAVGRLVPQKGFDVLLEAFATDELADPNLRLVVAGDGFERERLTSRAESLGLGARVEFLGSVGRERLGGLLLGARVFAFPSRGEPYGIALLEAMAAGVPAVATQAGGVVEFARDDVNVLLVDPDDPRALAGAIARAVADEQLAERLAAGGRETASELAWGRIAERYEQIYAQALERARR